MDRRLVFSVFVHAARFHVDRFYKSTTSSSPNRIEVQVLVVT